MRSIIVLASLLGLCLVTATGCASEPPEATSEMKIFTGPRFWTSDPEQPWADGLLVSRDRIARLLSREEIAQEAATGVEVRSLRGEVAFPGLVDAHAHIGGYGLARARIDLVGTASLAETLERIALRASSVEAGEWILGRGWDQNDWIPPRWPDADVLEAASRGRPAALRRVDGHALWVNRTALTIAGIDAATPDPEGGAILRDGAGRPTGILVDSAASLVERLVPTPDERQIEEALELAARELTAFGLTGVHDMGVDRRTWDAMLRLAEAGRFPLRVHAYADAGTDLHRQLLDSGPQESGTLRLEGVKLYADGALGSRGARLLEPYEDAKGTRGLWLTSPENLQRTIQALAAAGLQPAVHAIGDAANRAVLDAIEGASQEAPGLVLLRPRIEHVQVISPADLMRVSSLGAVASMQPTHATSDMPWAELRLGSTRLDGAYAWRSLLESGAVLAFGSDAPVESPDPRLGLFAAVTRRSPSGAPPGGWLPGERLTADQALEAFTAGAAAAVGREGELGRLVPGALCDITVFDRDPRSVPANGILTLVVTETIVGGTVVYPVPSR